MGHPSHFARGKTHLCQIRKWSQGHASAAGNFARFRISARLFGFRNSIFPQTDRFAGRERALRSGLRAPCRLSAFPRQPEAAGQPHALFSRDEMMSIPAPWLVAQRPKHPADKTSALAAAVSPVLFAWGLGEFLRSL
jgi:hypothetical protein